MPNAGPALALKTARSVSLFLVNVVDEDDV